MHCTPAIVNACWWWVIVSLESSFSEGPILASFLRVVIIEQTSPKQSLKAVVADFPQKIFTSSVSGPNS